MRLELCPSQKGHKGHKGPAALSQRPLLWPGAVCFLGSHSRGFFTAGSVGGGVRPANLHLQHGWLRSPPPGTPCLSQPPDSLAGTGAAWFLAPSTTLPFPAWIQCHVVLSVPCSSRERGRLWPCVSLCSGDSSRAGHGGSRAAFLLGLGAVVPMESPAVLAGVAGCADPLSMYSRP